MNEQTIQEMIDELKFIIVVLQRELKKAKKTTLDNDPFMNQPSYDIDKMMTGFTKGKLDSIRLFKETARELTDKKDSTAKSSVVEQLVKKGMSIDDIDNTMNLLLKTGEILETGPGRIKVV